jgi:hypothetical protein
MEAMPRPRIFETICCICLRKKGKSGWRQERISPFAELSHGYCPECYRQTMIAHGLVPELSAASR